jgi:uncharacterized protein YbjT (DUF2867 family)
MVEEKGFQMILVVGSTGSLGGRIVQQLLQAGHEVRILVRPDSPYQALIEQGAQLIFGDLKNADSLPSALDGIETVITTATAGSRGGEDTIERVDEMGNANLIEAAENAGVQQFIFISTLGSDPNSPVPMYRAKGVTEARLRKSKMNHTIIQANANLDVWVPMIIGLPLQQQRSVLLIGEGRRKHSFAAQQDVAAFVIAAIRHPAAHNQTIVVGGPSPVSWWDIIATVEVVLQRPISVETLAPGEQLPGLPPIISEIMAAKETYDSPINMEETGQTYGITLTPLETWVRSTLVPILA